MGGRGELDKGGQKVYTFSYRISSGDVMYNEMTIFNTAVWYI